MVRNSTVEPKLQGTLSSLHPSFFSPPPLSLSPPGWWLVTHDGKEGWAPASYLEPAGKCVPQDDKETDQGVFNSLHSNNAYRMPLGMSDYTSACTKVTFDLSQRCTRKKSQTV